MPWGHPRGQEETPLLSSGLSWCVTSNVGPAQRRSQSSEDTCGILDGLVQSRSCCRSWLCRGDIPGDRRSSLHSPQASPDFKVCDFKAPAPLGARAKALSSSLSQGAAKPPQIFLVQQHFI